MNTKKIIRIIAIFIVIYLIFGLAQTFVFGDNNFFEEFVEHSKSDALFAFLLWPFLYIMIFAMGLGVVGLLVGLAIDIALIFFLIKVALIINKKLFENKTKVKPKNVNNLNWIK